MSRVTRFTPAQLDEAEVLRAQGEKWIVVEAILGKGIQGACEYRRLRAGRPSVCTCNGGKLPCECRPDAWKLSNGMLVHTELEANAALEPGVTKHPLFMRGRM